MQQVVDRRDFLTTMTGAGAWAAFPMRSWATERESGPALRVDAQRLQRSLEELSVYGRPAGGTFSDGVSRVAYSESDVAGRSYVMGLMQAAGLTPRVDAVGNILARRGGRESAQKPILFGSHIDSVPAGGNFDGELGSLAAIEIVRTLNEHRIVTRHPLELTIWSNEEGGTIGSSATLGAVTAETLERPFNGIRMVDGLRAIGGDSTRLESARLTPGSFHCYLELHIEQGGILEQAGIPIGVVDGIVSVDEYAVEIRGVANHAGTTPMAERHNALLAAAKLIEAVQEEVTRTPGRQVGTVGQLAVFPNAANVVPGMVKHSIEFRDLSEENLVRLGAAIRTRAEDIARATGTDITLQQVEHLAPALATPEIQRQIELACKTLGLKSMHLPSGAGHDAQVLARLGPMGMIFVPSVGGISHSPKEFSRWADCANGANVLLQTILQIDQARAELA
jgi:beta-ureidopropionase / N-carbamoyl-L-amino-acid hydrolase